MPNITLHVHPPGGGDPESFEAPANFSAEVFLEDVIRHFRLPHDRWTIVDKSTTREIDLTKTLEGNGIQADCHLALAEKQPPPSPAERDRPIAPPREETVRCPKCGYDNIARSRFCTRCGDLLTGQAAEERLQAPPADIKLHIHTPDGLSAPVNIGLDLTLEELIEELRRAGTIPKGGNWRIYDDAGRELQPTLDLKENGLRSGNHVYVRGLAPPPPPKPAEVTAPTPERPALNYERRSDRKWFGLIIAVVLIAIVCWGFYVMLKPSPTHTRHPPPRTTFPPVHNPHPTRPTRVP